MVRSIAVLGFGVCILFAAGCGNNGWGLKRWGGSKYGQGDMFLQKNRAVSFDPYPLNDIGPEVVGGRPRGFIQPLSEPSRNALAGRERDIYFQNRQQNR